MAAAAQEVEQVLQWSEGRWFESRLLPAARQCVLEQNTEPRIPPDEQFGVLWMGRNMSPFTNKTIGNVLYFTRGCDVWTCSMFLYLLGLSEFEAFVFSCIVLIRGVFEWRVCTSKTKDSKTTAEASRNSLVQELIHLLAEGEAEMRSNSVLCYCTLFRYLYSVISDSFSLSPPTSEHKCRLT